MRMSVLISVLMSVLSVRAEGRTLSRESMMEINAMQRLNAGFN